MPTFRAVNNAAVASGTAWSVSAHADRVVGDVAWVAASFSGTPGSRSVTGWTEVGVPSPLDVNNPILYVWRRVVTGDSSDDFALTIGTARQGSLHWICYSDVDTTTPEDSAFAYQDSAGAGATTVDDPSVPLPSVTTAGAVIVGLAGVGLTSGTDPTAITNMAQRSQVTSQFISSLYDKSTSGTGAQSNETWTTAAARRYAWLAWAIRPGDPPPPPQEIRPDADVTTTGWTTTPLFSKINDESDASVITATAS
jgi:hypothetical protein